MGFGNLTPLDDEEVISPTPANWFPEDLVEDVTELAWAAGFFDGEGYVGWISHGKDKWSPRFEMTLSISQNDREVLDRFRRAVNLGYVYGPYIAPRTGKPFFRFALRKQSDIQVVYDKLEPYLSSVKRNQFIKTFEDRNKTRK